MAGLPGAGKSTISEMFVQKGFTYIRFGQIVIDEVLKRGLKINEQNERLVREGLRDKHGMAVMAKLNVPKFKKELLNNDVIGDGLYSFEEYKLLKKQFKDRFIVVCVYAPPELRYERLGIRTTDRKITRKDAISRDYAEIENLNKGGPIAMADYTIVNTKDMKYLKKQFEEIYKEIKN